MNKQPIVLLTDIPVDAVSDVVETVNQRTGKRVFFKAYSPEELQAVMRDAPSAVNRDPVMIGVRAGQVQSREMRTLVEGARRAEGSFISMGSETFTKSTGAGAPHLFGR